MVHKILLHGLGPVERQQHVGLGVDAVALHEALHQEGDVGVVEEHGHILHQRRVGAGDEGGVAVLEVHILDGERRAALRALHVAEHERVAHHQVAGAELAVDGEEAVALGVEGVAEAWDELHLAATVVGVLHNDAFAALAALLEYHQIDVDIALALAVVEEHQRLVGVGMHAAGDAVPLAALRAVVEHNIVDLAHTHRDGLDEASELFLGEHDVFGVDAHAYGSLGLYRQHEFRLFGSFLLLGTGLGLGFRLALRGLEGGGGQRVAVYGAEVNGHRRHLVEQHLVGEVDARVAVDEEVVVVPHALLGDVDLQLSVVGDGDLVPHRVVLALEDVGVSLVGHHLLHTAGTVGGRRRTVGLVHLQRYGEETVAAVVRQLNVSDNGHGRSF